jgi:hypothetical protein
MSFKPRVWGKKGGSCRATEPKVSGSSPEGCVFFIFFQTKQSRSLFIGDLFFAEPAWSPPADFDELLRKLIPGGAIL